MEVDQGAIEQQVERLAASQELARSIKLQRFIRFTVHESLAGRADSLTEYRIGTEVYDRPADFDPQTDGIVRTEARRLRRKLAHYYANAGQDDALILEFPVGSYVPTFHLRGTEHQLEFLANGGEMAERIRRFDWASTAIGPLDKWPQSLRVALNECLRSRFPSLLCWGPDGLVFYNDSKANEIGAKHPSALARPASEVFPVTWQRVMPLVDRVIQHGESVWARDERFLLETHGFVEERYFTLLFSPVWDGNGSRSGVLLASDETTARVISERRARLLGQLASRLSQVNDAAVACRAAASVLKENPYDVPFACFYLIRDDDKFTARLEATCGIPADTSISPEAVSLEKDEHGILSQAFRSGARQVIDMGETLRDLPVGPWERAPNTIGILPIETPPYGNPVGFLVTGINPHRHLDGDYRIFFELLATQIARAIHEAWSSDQERRRVEQFSSLQRGKTDFFQRMDSELRNLSMLLLGPLDHLLAAASDILGDQKGILKIARRNGLRLLKRINALLDFAAVEAGRSETFFEPLDLSVVTAELASMFRDPIERAGVRFLVECPPLSEPAYVDRDIWEKIVLNLISNAFKFTPGGEIGVSLRMTGNRFDLMVWDTGAGIPAGKRPTLFDSSHDGESGRARRSEGLGMGLALVREFAKLHRGSVQILSEEGKGSSVIVSIPAGKAHLPPDRVGRNPGRSFSQVTTRTFLEEALSWSEEEISTEHLARESAHAIGGWSEKAVSGHIEARILVVNDNTEMRDYLGHLLGSLYAVETAADREEALAAANRFQPDLVVADTSLSHDGLSLIRALRTGADKTIPVLLLSSVPAEEHRLRAFAGGADDYLLKPFSTRELLFRVQAQIILHRTRERATQEQERLRAETEAQRALLQAVLDQMPAGVVMAKAPSLEVLSENRTAAKLLGRPFVAVASVEPKRTWIGYRPDGSEYQPHEWPLSRCIKSGKASTDEEIEYVRPDGEHRHVLANAGPVRDSEGQVIAGVLTFQDITERKEMENALRANERRFRQVLDAAGEGVWCVDLEAKVTWCNRMMAEMLGYSVEELRQRSVFDFVFDDDREDVLRQFTLKLSGDESPFESRFRHKNGSAVWVTHAPKLLYDEKGDLEAIFCRMALKKHAAEEKERSRSRKAVSHT